MPAFRSCAFLALLGLAACHHAPESQSAPVTTAAAAIMPHPQASLIELMSGLVVPASDAIWNAVGSSDGPNGPVETRPATDMEWAELRRQAMLLAEAGNLLAVPDRAVLLPGQKLANPAGPGDLTPEQSAARIKAEWSTYLAYAQTLQNSALTTLKAIDARDLDAITEAGGAIDEACEQCHKRFWYP